MGDNLPRTMVNLKKVHKAWVKTWKRQSITFYSGVFLEEKKREDEEKKKKESEVDKWRVNAGKEG